MSIVVFILCLLIMLVGLAGTIFPVLPGIPIIWMGMLIFGWFSDWTYYGFNAMLVIGLIVVISVVVDQLASVLGAKTFGASRAGMIGSFVGAIVGLVVLNIIGLIIGTFLGAMVAELLFSGRNFWQSMASGTGALVGFLAGSLFKFMTGAGLIVYFIFRRILGG